MHIVQYKFKDAQSKGTMKLFSLHLPLLPLLVECVIVNYSFLGDTSEAAPKAVVMVVNELFDGVLWTERGNESETKSNKDPPFCLFP